MISGLLFINFKIVKHNLLKWIKRQKLIKVHSCTPRATKYTYFTYEEIYEKMNFSGSQKPKFQNKGHPYTNIIFKVLISYRMWIHVWEQKKELVNTFYKKFFIISSFKKLLIIFWTKYKNRGLTKCSPAIRYNKSEPI